MTVDETPIIHLVLEAQTVRNVLLDVMREEKLGTSTVAAEGIYLPLDPRREALSDTVVINGTDKLYHRNWITCDSWEIPERARTDSQIDCQAADRRY